MEIAPARPEIVQSPWVLTPEGEAVVLYTLTNSRGASVRVTNLGAALVSVNVPDAGGSVADVVAESSPLLWGGVWESRIEGNRVVFSALVPAPGDGAGEIALEVAYHWSDECELEILVSALSDGDSPAALDFVPRTRFVDVAEDRLLTIEGWRKNILACAGSINLAAGRRITVLTSLPAVTIYGAVAAESNAAPEKAAASVAVEPGERCIQKTVYKFEII